MSPSEQNLLTGLVNGILSMIQVYKDASNGVIDHDSALEAIASLQNKLSDNWKKSDELLHDKFDTSDANGPSNR